ncbi:MAG: hypothetical protein IJE15_10440, partial [Bacteroidaceae bacterium]|nr:hypothetical protein [Bacteroidaceae bacterium]
MRITKKANKSRTTSVLCTLLSVLFITACQQDDIVPDTPDAPTEGYHLTFDGGVGIETGTRAVWNDDNGSGNLIFQWDYTPEGTEDYEMVMAIVGGELVKSIEGNYHTYASIHRLSEHSDDAHWATFKTIETYPYDITGGKYEGFDVLAVAPICEANGASIVSHDIIFDATMLMPATFTQVADQEPDFLRNYMYMYAYEMIDDNRATLRFKHIPATFRFIITNKRPTEATIKSVQVSQTDAALPVASKWVSIDFQGNLSFSRSTHAAISTQLGENGTTVQKDAKYTAYALALPLADNNAFKDKKLQFTIEALDPDNEHLSFELDADKLAAANPNNEYNWVGGKSYTIRMSLNDVLTFEGITVDDWNEQDIVGGEAVEWVNGFSETGDYEPVQRNADGYYEIKNGGNLFWFANHVNTADRTANAVLTADIDLEGRPWTPIGSTGEESHNFRGVFDGQNYTIRGLNVEGGRAGLGFFGEVRTGIVRNFTIYGEVVVNTEVDYVGGVIGSICGLNGENDLERNGAVIQNITSYV